MSTIENLLKVRTRAQKRTRAYNRIRFHNIARSVSLAELEGRIEQMAEEEERQSMCERGVEVG